MLYSSLVLALTACSALAAPAHTVYRRDVTPLSSDQLADLAPFTQFARAAYCPSDKIQGWQCGQACDALPGFEPTLTGGDGNAVQLFFVGYLPQNNSVVVAHEGTDPTQLLSLLTDVEVVRRELNTTLFPGVSSDVTAHSGFADEHEKTASTVLAETQRLISEKGADSVLCVGHSLGGALAELDSLFMTLNLQSNIHVKGVTYGTPRVGNSDYVSLFDSKVPDFTRVNNEKDVIPIVPGRFLGFEHVHGEIHLISPGNAVACSGDDDATDAQLKWKGKSLDASSPRSATNAWSLALHFLNQDLHDQGFTSRKELNDNLLLDPNLNSWFNMESTLVSSNTKHEDVTQTSRSNSSYAHTSLSWSSSLPSLTSTSSSLTTISLSSRTSDLELLGRVEEGYMHEVQVTPPPSKRAPRRYHLWANSSESERPTRSPFFHFTSTRHSQPRTLPRFWKSQLSRMTLWDRVVFVLFSISLWILLRALAGRGGPGPNGAGGISVARLSDDAVTTTVSAPAEHQGMFSVPDNTGDLASLPPLDRPLPYAESRPDTSVSILLPAEPMEDEDSSPANLLPSVAYAHDATSATTK
ncbi:hypothetical protein NM688_g7156 [Phlebia brevispora]|uniref:Uncharacterized protein n=1 Tax=Phlebia brevispora TaxID=194682 RepID=A0ACC1S8F9_9APHY|nr:hypothetical protein NM688_g7156 [Phlebia brevispora]